MKHKALQLLVTVVWALFVGPYGASRAHAQLFENLEAFGRRLDVGDDEVPSDWQEGREGPKGIATADFDDNGTADLATSNLDGTITVLLNDGAGRFAEPTHLHADQGTLRGIVAADFNNDGLVDLAATAPLRSQLVIFLNVGGGSFADARLLETWPSARDLVAGDFNGDGLADLVIGGGVEQLFQYNGQGNGSFQKAQSIGIREEPGNLSRSTRPVYSLRAFRLPDADRDSFVATHAWSSRAWIVAAEAGSPLAVQQEVPIPGGIYDLEVAPVTRPASEGRPDLVLASRASGRIIVRRGAAEGALFERVDHLTIDIPGAPRSIRVTDLDGDGWNDLVVVLRCLDRVLTYRNDQGTFVESTEIPVGRSPRDLAPADYNGDGQLDFAVINRISQDVSIVSGFAGEAGLGVLDLVYPVDGEVADLVVVDFNGDGRDDVLQAHRASSDISVRFSGEEGRLEEPVFYSMGTNPSRLCLVDVNHDGTLDATTSNLGWFEGEQGSISVRLGDGKGGFGELARFSAPADEQGGQLFGMELADFNGDGNLDAVVGYLDCRIGFFQGDGLGGFQFRRAAQFAYESRALVTGDFDQDGDIDVAGAGYQGDVVVLENDGELFTEGRLRTTEYPWPSSEKFRTQSMRVLDADKDGDPDLAVGSGEGVMLYRGQKGMGFVLAEDQLGGVTFPTSALATADFDGNGKPDLAVACQVFSCVIILTQNDDGDHVPALSVDVPAGKLVATGDLDGDGHADLVGSGAALWTALSSRRAGVGAPPEFISERSRQPGPVINEILAINNFFLSDGTEKHPDWAEFYNGADEDVDLSGWRLVRTKLANPGSKPKIYAFPSGTVMEPASHLQLFFTREERSPFHTGFRLPGKGAVLQLFDPEGIERDRVTYGRQFENVAFARYTDGAAGFAFNRFPSRLEANVDNGPIPPDVSLGRVQSAAGGLAESRLAQPGEPIQFVASGRDDVGIVSLSIVYQRLDLPDSPWERFILFDDGLHDDGAMQDGLFSGVLTPGLPDGASIRFQLEAYDLDDTVTRFPDSTAPSLGTGSPGFYTFAMENVDSPFEISEVVPGNHSGLLDEGGGTPDWVEIRNCSEEPQSLRGILVGDAYPNSDKWFSFSDDAVLQPGEHVTLLCDGFTQLERFQGVVQLGPPQRRRRHTGFTLPIEGSSVVLVGTNDVGAHVLLDLLEYPAVERDISYARMGCGGEFAAAQPTPETTNQLRSGDADGNAVLDITDPLAILNFLIHGSPIGCRLTADANNDGALDLSDAVYLLTHLFLGGPAPRNVTQSCD